IGSEQGYARFIASSEGDWSGKAKLIISWANQTKEETIEGLPPGLPASATNFSVIIGGLDQSNHVLATFLALTCTIGPVPDDLGAKCRDGEIPVPGAY